MWDRNSNLPMSLAWSGSCTLWHFLGMGQLMESAWQGRITTISHRDTERTAVLEWVWIRPRRPRPQHKLRWFEGSSSLSTSPGPTSHSHKSLLPVSVSLQSRPRAVEPLPLPTWTGSQSGLTPDHTGRAWGPIKTPNRTGSILFEDLTRAEDLALPINNSRTLSSLVCGKAIGNLTM